MLLLKKDKKIYSEFVNTFINNLNHQKILDRDDFPIVTDEDRVMIKDFLFNFNYNKKLKPLTYKLYKYTDTENLLYCCLNLYNVQVLKKHLYYQKEDSFFLVSGLYNATDNLIVYSKKEDISHELLHLCATKPSQNNHRTGFYYIANGKGINRGINEGYTELLNRRIFFNENYKSDSYTKNIYFMRLFELLYDNIKDMENDYFKANYHTIENEFTKYGTLDELAILSNTMNKIDCNIDKEETIKTFDMLTEIIRRTESDKKIKRANEITDEYLNHEKLLTKKLHL